MKLVLFLSLFTITSFSADLDLLKDPNIKHSSYLSTYMKVESGSIRVKIPSGKQWPGFTLNLNKYDVYKYDCIKAVVKNLSNKEQTFLISVKDHRGKSTVSSKTIAAKTISTITLKLTRKDDQWNSIKLFGMRTLPWMERIEEPADLHNLKSIGISIDKSLSSLEYEISSICLTGKYSPEKFPKSFFPFIDKYGQYVHKDWAEKINSDEHLKAKLEGENLKPLFKNKFGSFNSHSSFDIKGHFYTKKVNGKWLIIDPEGKPFYSMGMNAVNFSRETPYSSREKWFDIADKGNFISISKKTPVHGFYKGRQVNAIDFLQWNLNRKYGSKYQELIRERTLERFKAWGVNTVGAWSDKSLYGKKHPYTIIIQPWSRGIDASNGHYGKFPDVFDKDFINNIEKAVLSIDQKFLNDPYCLGIFIHNELPWGDETNFAYWSLFSYNYQPAKKEFIKDLKVKYKNISALNKVWGSKLDSWETLLDKRFSPNYFKASKDLLAFSQKFAERYFKVCKDAVQKHAPGRLYLGCRFAYNNRVASAAAVKYCDIVSVNLYYPGEDIAEYSLPGQTKDAAPLIVGEFHFGAKDRGFAKGLRGADTQEDRTEMMKEYIKNCMKHPGFVGTHWFQMYDQPVTGRVHDGENYQVGFVDITDSPYQKLVNTLKSTIAKSSHIYLPKIKNEKTLLSE